MCSCTIDDVQWHGAPQPWMARPIRTKNIGRARTSVIERAHSCVLVFGGFVHKAITPGSSLAARTRPDNGLNRAVTDPRRPCYAARPAPVRPGSTASGQPPVEELALAWVEC